MRDFSKVSPKLWRSSRFRKIHGDAKLFYLYLLTCEHQTSAGAFRLPAAYAADDLGWTVEQMHAASKTLVGDDMIVHDLETFEIFVKRWFRHNPPTNAKHLKGVQRIISDLDSDTIREAAEAELTEQQGNTAPDGAPWEVRDTGTSRLASSNYLRGMR